jgi:hypothetical protein
MAVVGGPVFRHLSTSVGDFFGDLVGLTLKNKLVQGQVPE